MADIVGSAGAEMLIGTAGDDIVDALGGDDQVWAGAGDTGNDILSGGDGSDTLAGGAGDDVVIGDNHDGATDLGAAGDDGSNVLFGGDGNDLLISGGYSNDGTDATLAGAAGGALSASITGTGNSRAWAGAGDDIVYGAAGDDMLGGGAGNDEVNGGAGNDTIYGGGGADTLNGGAGDDQIFNGAGNDVVDGGEGNDEMWGGAGDDTLTGGAGDDTFGFIAGNGSDTVTDFNVASDTLRLDGTAFTSVADVTAAMTDSANGVVLDLGNGQTVTLAGRTVSDFTGTGNTWLNLDGSDVAPVVGQEINLTSGTDRLDGTAGDDQFNAYVQQNAFAGGVSNSLSSADHLNGGAGSDSLYAELTDEFSGVNGGGELDVQPRTNSIETVEIEARDTAGGTGTVHLDAKHMHGVNSIGSKQSDANLVIENLTTLDSNGNARNTDAITITMDHTENTNSNGDAADLTVYFDEDYLLAGQSTGTSEAYYWLLDEDSDDYVNKPLENIERNGVSLTIDGVAYDIVMDDAVAAAADTWAAFAAGLQARIDQMVAEGNSALSGITVSVDPTNTDETYNDAGVLVTIPAITLTDSQGRDLVPTGFLSPADATGAFDIYGRFDNVPSVSTDDPVTVNVDLHKVGREGEGGELTIGGKETTEEGEGIARFLVDVMGAANKPSHLARLQSTNNALETVIVSTHIDYVDGDSFARLEIGGTNTPGGDPSGATAFASVDLSSSMNNALKDVLTFDSSAHKGEVELHAHFSDDVVGKYLNLTDSDGNPRADNSDAVYTFGDANDELNVNISKTNMAVMGTATREDFSFTANMGDGDDLAQVQIGDGVSNTGNSTPGANGLPIVQSWYLNHVINQNLAVNTGAGNDTVELWGSTAADVNLGSGNDVIYTDNSAENGAVYNDARATWVFNSLNADVDDLDSQDPASVDNVANLRVTVTFQDIEVTVNIADTFGVNGATVTDLDINQAIKDAINNDATLSKLLVAEDGPGNTLVVRSLIDGEHLESDLDVSLSQTALTTAQTNAGNAAHLLGSGNEGTLGFDAGGNAVAGPGARYDSEFAQDNSSNLTGLDSGNVNNNDVEGGTGDDVIVLSSNGVGNGEGVFGTGLQGNSVETLTITGAFGNDTVLNFTAAAGQTDPAQANGQATTGNNGFDIIDLTASGVLDGTLEGFGNDTTDNQESAVIGALSGDDRNVAIIDTLEADDYGFSAANLSTEQRIAEIFNATVDTAASTGAENSVVITVDGNNVGTFYLVTNGTGAGDSTVTRLGSIEMAQYDDAAKAAIGDWDAMTAENFQPLSVADLTDTFDIA